MGSVDFIDKDKIAYSPLICQCGEICGAKVVATTFPNINYLDSLLLVVSKIIFKQNDCNFPLSEITKSALKVSLRSGSDGQTRFIVQ